MCGRAGPFQPSPAPFQSHYSDEPSTTFGIDLRKFDETNGDRESRPLPRVLELLLEWAEKKGQEVSDDGTFAWNSAPIKQKETESSLARPGPRAQSAASPGCTMSRSRLSTRSAPS